MTTRERIAKLMTTMPHVRLGACLLLLFAAALPGRAPIPAFPGAEGFGAFTVGGRGGDVYLVTNLDDYASGEEPIPGSLRAAVAAEGPRTVVFRVAGVIALKRTLEIKEPYLTVAGQTAPGEGITIAHHGMTVEAPQVILRHLRVRPGDVAGEETDAINVQASDVVIDHVSVSWATDETLSVIGDATNVTIQWCLITESLNRSVHSKGEHGYGSLLSTSGEVTIHHTAYALHKSRNPRPRDVLLDFRNNLVYGWGDRAGYNADDFTRMNYVGNYVHPLAYSGHGDYAFIVGGPHSRFYLEDNLLRAADGIRTDDWAMIRPPDGIAPGDVAERLGAAVPFAAPTVATDPPEVALARILDGAGATRPVRDAVDRRVVALIRAGEGRIIDSQDDVGGWPAVAPAEAPPDADADGMPDAWEQAHGLDPSAPDHAADADGDGYTNLEEYLNDTDPNEPFAWVPPPVLRPGHGTAFADTALVVAIESAAPGLPVHYTLDGREPTAASPRYETPLCLSGDTHLRARVVAADRPTTAAYAAYDRLAWQEAVAAPPADLVPGLAFARYEADDWDEGPPPDALRPVETGTLPGLDFDGRPTDGHDALVFDGYLDVPQDGIYAFHFHDDARSRLYLGDRLVARGSPAAGAPARVALRRGLHRFHLRSLHEDPRPARLQWSGPGFDAQPIPPSAFRRSAGTP